MSVEARTKLTLMYVRFSHTFPSLSMTEEAYGYCDILARENALVVLI